MQQAGESKAEEQSLDVRIRHLEDRAALSELIAAYATCVAQGRGAELTAMFVPEGVFRPGLRSFEGEALRALFLSMQPTNTIPLVGNLILEVSGDEASGTSTLFSRMPGEVVRFYSGYYADRFRRVGGEWKFVSRDFTFYHDQGGNADKK